MLVEIILSRENGAVIYRGVFNALAPANVSFWEPLIEGKSRRGLAAFKYLPEIVQLEESEK